jgi:hypothetical protein
MKRIERLEPEFVDHIPAKLKPGIVYISIPFGTAMHLCCCGCGNEVVTPIQPARWNFTYDGDTISLQPSIGNWALTCQSHYVIRRGDVRWARQWTAEEIAAGRQRDRDAINQYFGRSSRAQATRRPSVATDASIPQRPGVLRRWWRLATKNRH